jgi:outer membrane protein OmpA-like peptidoglycan-associated protein
VIGLGAVAVGWGLLAAPAGADLPERSLYAGFEGGGWIAANGWGLHDGAADSRAGGGAGHISARVGGQVVEWLALEACFGVVPQVSTTGGQNLALHFSGDAVATVTPARFRVGASAWAPLLGVGGGAFHNAQGDLGRDTDFEVHMSVGMRIMALDEIAVRIELRNTVTDGARGEQIAYLAGLAVGIDFHLVPGGGALATELDADADGVSDGVDVCPSARGSREATGCPDADRDGVADATDRCPDAAGSRLMEGCPDGDQDGVADPIDACPALAGFTALGGCPDRDSDTVIDGSDRCPEKPGYPALYGCPDADADGIADPDDRCPELSGIGGRQGCPATDEAQCAEVVRSTMTPEAKRFAHAVPPVTFAIGSAKLKPQAQDVLALGSKILAEHPGLVLEIRGHTDREGSDNLNQNLAQLRAEAVRDFLTARGVSLERLRIVAKGHGEPRYSDETTVGRGYNRRVELVALEGL